ncbi:hypothetical protein ACUXCC_002290 [Cytobacillus horneckiae]|uniref:hypothetical protein n=1 Tax=Cytobacillus horneckiae TaxID=549687 RepID=UPI0019D08691|nr:hypothetical protein [Cytobacillus horneckiae]MBN6887274.1 hypothetical protein [Cytobacillus horneckiae]
MEKISEMTIIEYKYDSEEEREQHVKWMESQGFECSGQIRKSDDSLLDESRKYYWFGSNSKKF